MVVEVRDLVELHQILGLQVVLVDQVVVVLTGLVEQNQVVLLLELLFQEQ